MRVKERILAVVCTAVAFAGAELARAQEAATANLPDQFQTGEMTSHSKSKKKKGERNAQTFATAPKQNTTPPSEATSAAEELPPIMPTEEKKAGPNQAVETHTSGSTSQDLTKPAALPEKPVTAVVPAERKPRSKKRTRPRPRPPVQSDAASIPAPVPMSLSVAQSMAITAPLPEYPYEAKRRNLSGSGICVVTVDAATGTVTDATMSQSTGSSFLDKFTIQTFKNWRFKPDTVSQLRVPISYE